MIYEGSRYATDQIVRVTTATGAVLPAIFANRYADKQRFQFDLYTAKDGDRYDILAQRLYADPELWWVIARANPEVFYPDAIPFGVRLRIPRARSVL